MPFEALARQLQQLRCRLEVDLGPQHVQVPEVGRQVIVWARVKALQRVPLLRARLMAVKGTWQREGDVRNLIAGHIEDLAPLLGRLATSSRDFR